MCAIIDGTFFEPRVRKSFFSCDTIVGVVDEDAAEQVKEKLVESGRWGNDFLKKKGMIRTDMECK